MAKTATTTTSAKGRKASTPKPSREQVAAADAAKHAPVSLPSGASYDVTDLGKALDKAVDRQSGNRDAEVAAALRDTAVDGSASPAPNALPDHKLMRVETQLAAGTVIGEGKDKRTVGGETVTEFRQVYDPSSAPTDTEAAPVISGVGLGDGQHSEILSMTEVKGPPITAPASSTSDAGAIAGTGAGADVGTLSATDASAARADSIQGQIETAGEVAADAAAGPSGAGTTTL